MNPAVPRQEPARVISNRPLTPEVHDIVLGLSSGWGPPRAGQFVQIDCPPREAFALRRPFSLSGFRSDDRGDRIEIVYGAVGDRTRALARLRPDEYVNVVGPLGHPFTPFPGRHPILVGGGRGIAPLRMLAEQWKGEYPYGTILYGARSGDCLIPLPEVPYTVHLATDDGTVGVAGTAVDLLELLHARGEVRPSDDALFACGPNAMLRALSAWARANGYPCQVSLETLFGCGYGICAGCAVPVREGSGEETDAFGRYMLACRQGPVVDGTRIEWEGVCE